ncbi:MAG: AAA family ATPase [Chthoniobacterales bacterium]|nr:AAA family ATPase [Chthoniobacterales bacterium]
MARPNWFRLAQVRVTIVSGPPGSGKSTYISRRRLRGDHLICFDDIASRMFGREGAIRARALLSLDQILDVLRARNAMIGETMDGAARAKWRHVWIPILEPVGVNREWWNKTVGAEVIRLEATQDVCAHRICADSERGDDRGPEILDSLNRWFDSFSPSRRDHIVRSMTAYR